MANLALNVAEGALAPPELPSRSCCGGAQTFKLLTGTGLAVGTVWAYTVPNYIALAIFIGTGVCYAVGTVWSAISDDKYEKLANSVLNTCIQYQGALNQANRLLNHIDADEANLRAVAEEIKSDETSFNNTVIEMKTTVESFLATVVKSVASTSDLRREREALQSLAQKDKVTIASFANILAEVKRELPALKGVAASAVSEAAQEERFVALEAKLALASADLETRNNQMVAQLSAEQSARQAELTQLSQNLAQGEELKAELVQKRNELHALNTATINLRVEYIHLNQTIAALKQALEKERKALESEGQIEEETRQRLVETLALLQNSNQPNYNSVELAGRFQGLTQEKQEEKYPL